MAEAGAVAGIVGEILAIFLDFLPHFSESAQTTAASLNVPKRHQNRPTVRN
jgi:hypothetical protein